MNDDFLQIALILLLIAAAGGIAIFAWWWIKQSLINALRTVAVKVDGRVRDPGLLNMPSLRFRHGNAEATLDYHHGGKNQPDFTQLHVSWPDPRFRCELYPEGWLARLGKQLLGMNDLKIGDERFDHDYVITSNQPDGVRELLHPELRNEIDGFRRRHSGQVHLIIQGGLLTVKCHGKLTQYDRLVEFIDAVLAIYDAAIAADAPGIQFHDPSVSIKSMASGKPVCQICGDEVVSEPVYCRRCRTPHHRDCWSYYGGCSTYGCGESKFFEAKR